MTDPLRLTLAQINPVVGDLDGNADRMVQIWNAYNERSDLIIFPELCLCGYPPEDLILNAAFIKQCAGWVSWICEMTRHCTASALIPAPWEIDGNIYNAALLIEQGEIAQVISKRKLPNYSVFDEKRTFADDMISVPVYVRGHNLGIMICEDLWSEEVPNILKSQGAEILIAINGSPYAVDQIDTRRHIARERVSETGLDLIYLNLVGGQDELVFDGNSFVMDRTGTLVHRAKAFEEDIVCLTLTQEEKGAYTYQDIDVTQGQNHKDLPPQPVYEAMTLGLRDYVRKNGFQDVLIGLSGGIDSALCAAVAVDALGPEHVRCVMLPSAFTSQESLEDAQACIDMLGPGVAYETISIQDAVSQFETLIPGLSGLAHENTQSRLRGVILMALSNMSGALLLTTGNKSEMATGYCTLYGDMNGSFNPLKDIYKTQVYDLSKWRGLPERLLTKAPSAELREGQTDQDSLPPYDILDDILYILVECAHLSADEITDPRGVKALAVCHSYPDDVHRVAKLLKNTEYKRNQAPPGPRVSFCAFGRDRRYPLTNRFVNIVEKAS